MRTIAASLRSILANHPLELEALHRGHLNRSAFAKSIQDDIQRETLKSVRLGTIVTALGRYAVSSRTQSSLLPPVRISTLSIQSDLMDVSYEKTAELLERIAQIDRVAARYPRAVFVRTIGVSEVTFVASSEVMSEILTSIPIGPKALYSDLVAITVAFDASYLDTPNTIYTLLTSIASRRINIIEIISTYTELTVVINAQDREECINALELHFGGAKEQRHKELDS